MHANDLMENGWSVRANSGGLLLGELDSWISISLLVRRQSLGREPTIHLSHEREVPPKLYLPVIEAADVSFIKCMDSISPLLDMLDVLIPIFSNCPNIFDEELPKRFESTSTWILQVPVSIPNSVYICTIIFVIHREEQLELTFDEGSQIGPCENQVSIRRRLHPILKACR
jgi:hypothetical protein